MRLKGILTLLLLLVARAAIAADSLLVREPQTPILLDRTDNILYELRIDASPGDTLNAVTLRLDPGVNLRDIRAIRLFYGGVEGPSRKGTHLSPAPYLSSHRTGETRQAIEAYSVRHDELASPASHTLTLTSGQPLPGGINYFWVSVQLDRRASLLTRIRSDVERVEVNHLPQPIHWRGKAPLRRVGIGLRQAGDDGAAAYRIPGLATTRRGTLIGVYDIRYNSSADLQEKIDIGVSRSVDGGQTWEPMRVAMSFKGVGGLPDSQNGVGDPSVLVDERTNTIWIVAAWCHGMGNQRAWWNSMPGMDPGETAQLVLTRSDDDGQTWSEPINITRQVKDPSWHFLLQGPGRGITTHDGTLVFPIQFIDSTRVPNAGIMYSRDRGKTWHIHNPARSNTTEAQVAEVSPGTLMLNMRDNRGGSRAVAVTRDWGRTWTEHPSSRSALPEPVCMASLLHVSAADNATGRDLLLFSNPNTTKGRHHITLKASLDGGLTWPSEYQILLDEEEGWGYSCLTLIDRETVGILYESSVAQITFQAIPLADLIPQAGRR